MHEYGTRSCSFIRRWFMSSEGHCRGRVLEVGMMCFPHVFSHVVGCSRRGHDYIQVVICQRHTAGNGFARRSVDMGSQGAHMNA